MTNENNDRSDPYSHLWKSREIVPRSYLHNKWATRQNHFDAIISTGNDNTDSTRVKYDFQCSIFYGVSFRSTIFNGEADFRFAIFNGEADFYGSEFKYVSHFRDAIFELGTCFDCTIFHNIVRFKETKFKNIAKFNHVQFLCGVEFIDTQFGNDAEFNDAEFNIKYGITKFTKAKFNGEAKFTKAEFHHENEHSVVIFSEAKFNGEAKFNEAKFYCIARFNRVEFIDKSLFSNVEFYGETIFDNTKFNNEAIFHKVYFMKKVNFDFATFKDEATFYNAKFNEKASFKSSIFKERAIFSTKETSNAIGEISFSNTIFSGVAFFNNRHFKKMTFKATTIEKQINLSSTYVSNPDREYWRVKKNEMIKLNDKVEALNCYKNEMSELSKEKSFYTPDNLLLLLNKLSNNYNTNWMRGVLFTLILGFLFYVLYQYPYNTLPIGYDYHFKRFISFIIPFNVDFIKHDLKELCTLSYLIYFLSRIFIGYGIYQTIQAFRKYGKIGI